MQRHIGQMKKGYEDGRRSMPVCDSCGSEISAGKNFCSRCGAPVAKPALPLPSPPADPHIPPSPPSQQPPPYSIPPSPALSPGASLPPVTSPKPKLSPDKIIIAVVMGAAILGLIIFIGIPLLQTPGTTALFPGSSLSPFSDPAPTTPPSGTTPASSTGTVSFGPTVYRSGVPYEQVYARDYDLNMAQDVFSYTLQQPPMIIECDMNPDMVTREKLVDIGKSTERYITTTYGDPNAWLDLKVIDADTGRIVTTISFSKNYVGMTKQDYTIRAQGNYRFELTGNLVSPSVRLLVKK